MSYKEKIKIEIEKAFNESKGLVTLERPKQKDHGDLATNIALKLAKDLQKPPRDIANEVKEKTKTDLITAIEIAGPGFINIRISDKLFAESILEVINNPDYGICQDKNKGSVLVEYVSANPTGDLHIGHGRQAVIGDCLSNLLDAAGYKVAREFYINDYGEQARNLSNTAQACLEELEGKTTEWKEEYYPKESIMPYVERLQTADNRQQTLEELIENTEQIKHVQSQIEDQIVNQVSPEVLKQIVQGLGVVPSNIIGEQVKNAILKEQKKLLSSFGVNFSKWFSETTLHDNGKVEEVLKLLEKKEQTYEDEGAIWFKAKEFGDVRDRVLKRSDGRPTYLLADYAYHLDKLNRGVDYLINVWGADHHGQEVGLRGGLKACGKESEKLEVVFVQMVSLKRAGEEVKMSKRTGTVVTVKEVLDEVGRDAFRYFLIESSFNNRMVFDIELAKKQDKDNPVFYIQYAHARCCSIFRQAEEYTLDLLSIEQALNVEEKEKSVTKILITKILDFEEEVEASAQNRAPNRIATYLKELASDFHQFYTVCRVITENKEITNGRLAIVEATKITIANGLKILGISAPISM